MIQKYGIPNPSYLHCTRELKLQVMHSYLRSIGLNHKDIPTAIGIREDETRRVSKQAEVNNIIYPLINDFPADKQDVLEWWSKQAFDLEIPEYQGNCVGCFKKSFKKQFKTLDENPSALDFFVEMERLYPQVGNREPHYIDEYEEIFDHSILEWDELEGAYYPKYIGRKVVGQKLITYPDRVFFRGNTSALQLLDLWRSNKDLEQLDMFLDGGCSESCEVYLTE